LIGASATKGSDEVATVEVVVNSQDAAAIRDREIYFSIVVFDCASSQPSFPVQPHVGERLASSFSFPVTDEPTIFRGSMPQRVLANYSSPCVFLRGGSYFLGRIQSNPIPLELRSKE